ncbi:MAG: response regulator [Acidimicrobiales bacterium]|nr:response regulator [Acidimicrobiales bacterium]MDG1845758.1 response regulator [Acidimicrobiales bacterium]
MPRPENTHQIQIVIAEDEAIIRLDLRESLKSEGYEVVGETGRGDEAVELVRSLKPDVAILDIKMPGITGIEAAKKISDERLAAVLILTAFSQRELIHEASEAGALAYLVKPFQRSELVPAVELATARFAEINALKDQAAFLKDDLDSRKLIDRAKGYLMDGSGMGEKEAYRYLQTQAMEKRTTMRKVSETVIKNSGK